MLRRLQESKWERVLLIGIGLCVLLAGILSFVAPPGADTDPCYGFLIMHSMEQGYPFNLLISPSPGNIANNQSEFLTWWSPGQYLLPYFFKSLFSINVGRAVSLTVTLCNFVGLVGFYRLFRQLGFSAKIAAISIAFIASQLYFISTFTYYTGGELLLFAFIGWFIYGCFYFKKVSWKLLLFLFVASFVGFFAKSSVLWMFAAGIACSWINISLHETAGLANTPPGEKFGQIKKATCLWLKNGLLLAIPLFSALLALYIIYLSKGENPAGTGGALTVLPETFIFPLASPFVSGFSVDEIFDGLIYQPDGPLISYHLAVLILAGLTVLSITYLVLLTRFPPGKPYLIAFTSFYVTAVVFFICMYLKQSGISYEARHFRIIGVLATPGVISLLLKTKVTRLVFALMWLAFIWAGTNAFLRELKFNGGAARGNLGISEQVYDKATMKEILRLDKEEANKATFVVMSPDIAAELRYNRVITIDTESNDETMKYQGRCGNLYVLMPVGYVTNHMAAMILNNFTGYHNFLSRQLSPGFYLYTAKD